MLLVVIVEILTVNDEALLHRNAAAVEHAHLLGLGVVDRRLATERVQVVFGERLLRHWRRGQRIHFPPRLREPLVGDSLAHPIEIAGNELQLGIAKRRAAAVLERDPPIEIGALVVARDGEHVVGVPRQLAGKVRRLDPMRLRAAIGQRPDERWPAVQVVRQLRKPDVIGVHAGDDFLADTPHRRVVVAEELRFDFFLMCGAVLLHGADERDLTTDVLAQQLVGLEQVVLVVLLQHVDARGLGQRSEMHGRRIDGRGNVHELEVEISGRQRQTPHITDERDVGVIDGERQLDLIVECGHVLAGTVRWRRIGHRP